jgi:hypothetical protein
MRPLGSQALADDLFALPSRGSGWRDLGDNGSVRRVSQHVTTPDLVFKTVYSHWDMDHQANEVNAIFYLRETHPELRPYLPETYYWLTAGDHATEVVVVMEHLYVPPGGWDAGGPEHRQVRAFLDPFSSDVHRENFGRRDDGQLVVFDFSHTYDDFSHASRTHANV